jgi:D-glycero-alpha-D-manno-heptose 1-phosphate guanylyltransferase
LTVLNGDTLFKSDLKALAAFYQNKNADMAMALRRMYNFDRYGLVETDENNRVKSFLEKQYCEQGLINAGVYVFKAGLLLERFAFGEKFSFEKDFMERFVADLQFFGLEQDGYFIDIGIPEDFEKANLDLSV